VIYCSGCLKATVPHNWHAPLSLANEWPQQINADKAGVDAPCDTRTASSTENLASNLNLRITICNNKIHLYPIIFLSFKRKNCFCPVETWLKWWKIEFLELFVQNSNLTFRNIQVSHAGRTHYTYGHLRRNREKQNIKYRIMRSQNIV